jgi:cytochrome c
MKAKYTLAIALAIGAAAAGAATATAGAATAGEQRVTAKEAEAMVRKGVAYIKANPRDTALAHGANEKFVGKNMIELRDADGKEHIRERMELAKTKSTFWQDFKFVNPVTKKMEPKQMYCEKANELIVCGGIYKAM